ncbi:hypothetical protein VTL71DRAFT_10728 [Oculimacula yallundae]|uniref:Uncharacterized protein n=1 Tax=Oculimacula yallundae TaxID=86028 RepID=A0ABR4CTV1_9HELO
MSSHILMSGSPRRVSMRTHRKPYKKSTKGCSQYVTIRVELAISKIFNYLPASQSRGVIRKPSSRAKSSSQSSASRSPLPRSLSLTPVGITSSHLLELRLMHHYTKSVCSKPPPKFGNSLYNTLWNFEIPQVAFSSELVLNALLGITSLNLLSLNPNDKSLLESAWSHFDKAVVMQRTATVQMDPQNAEPMIIAAILLAHYNWLCSFSEGNMHPVSIEVDTYNMCKGILSLAQSSSSSLEKYESIPQVVVEVPVDSPLDQHFMDVATDDMETLLESLEMRQINQRDNGACHKYAEEILQIYTLIASGCDDNSGLEQKILTVMHRVPEPFVQLLRVNDPMALALLARQFMCLALLEDSSAVLII